MLGSLHYLTKTRPDILYGVELISRYMESPIKIPLQNAKGILLYIKGTLDYGMFYISSVDPSFLEMH